MVKIFTPAAKEDPIAKIREIRHAGERFEELESMGYDADHKKRQEAVTARQLKYEVSTLPVGWGFNLLQLGAINFGIMFVAVLGAGFAATPLLTGAVIAIAYDIHIGTKMVKSVLAAKRAEKQANLQSRISDEQIKSINTDNPEQLWSSPVASAKMQGLGLEERSMTQRYKEKFAAAVKSAFTVSKPLTIKPPKKIRIRTDH